MAHPKRRTSTTRRDKRRTHFKLTAASLTTCPTTGQAHLRHRAYWHEDKLYYKGRVIVDKAEAEEVAE